MIVEKCTLIHSSSGSSNGISSSSSNSSSSSRVHFNTAAILCNNGGSSSSSSILQLEYAITVVVVVMQKIWNLVAHGEEPGAGHNLRTRKHFRIVILPTNRYTINQSQWAQCITNIELAVVMLTAMVLYKCRRRVTRLGMTLISLFSCFFLPLRSTAPPRSRIKHIWVVSPTPYRSLPLILYINDYS